MPDPTPPPAPPSPRAEMRDRIRADDALRAAESRAFDAETERDAALARATEADLELAGAEAIIAEQAREDGVVVALHARAEAAEAALETMRARVGVLEADLVPVLDFLLGSGDGGELQARVAFASAKRLRAVLVSPSGTPAGHRVLSSADLGCACDSLPEGTSGHWCPRCGRGCADHHVCRHCGLRLPGEAFSTSFPGPTRKPAAAPDATPEDAP